MVKLRWVRNDRAKKLGRYLNFRAAAKIRSLVSCGMESATLDRLMTRETVAGERSRGSANFLRRIGLRAACAAPSLVGFALSDLGFFMVTERSLAQSKRWAERGSCDFAFSTFFF